MNRFRDSVKTTCIRYFIGNTRARIFCWGNGDLERGTALVISEHLLAHRICGGFLFEKELITSLERTFHQMAPLLPTKNVKMPWMQRASSYKLVHSRNSLSLDSLFLLKEFYFFSRRCVGNCTIWSMYTYPSSLSLHLPLSVLRTETDIEMGG